MDLKALLKQMLSREASDLHLRVKLPPVLRIHGQLHTIGKTPLSVDDMQSILDQMLSRDQQQVFQKKHEVDLALSISQVGRFRVNVYRQRGTVGIAIRSVKPVIPPFEDLHLPQVIKKLADEQRGLILLTGTTGSGKSTTLAAMIEHVNQTRSVNIVTIEDPVEYTYTNKKSIIYQREVGSDTESFASALRHAFRQDPDVILLGEIRDYDTMSIALQAADTGHLVMSTLHTLNAIETVNRIISFFPPHQHEQIRLLLAGTLRAIISQRLIPRTDKPGRVPAVEIMVTTAAVRDYLIDPLKTPLIIELMEEGFSQYGMQSFDQSIMGLYKDGYISYDEAILHTARPDDFELKVKGITGAAERGWQEFESSDKKSVDASG